MDSPAKEMSQDAALSGPQAGARPRQPQETPRPCQSRLSVVASDDGAPIHADRAPTPRLDADARASMIALLAKLEEMERLG